MGDDIGSGSVTDCRLRSDSDPLSSTKLPYGKNQNKPFYRFRCHHPLINQLNQDLIHLLLTHNDWINHMYWSTKTSYQQIWDWEVHQKSISNRTHCWKLKSYSYTWKRTGNRYFVCFQTFSLEYGLFLKICTPKYPWNCTVADTWANNYQ